MNKKIVFLISLLLSVFLLVSCSTKKLWTFEEEIKSEQLSYSENIKKYLFNLEWFYEWKFSWKGNLDFWISSNWLWDLSLKLEQDAKSIIQKDNVAVSWDIKFEIDSFIPEEAKDSLLFNYAWTKWKLKWKFLYGIIKNLTYFNLKEFSHELNWPESVKPFIENFIKKYEESKDKFLNKWFSIELPGNEFGSINNSLSVNTRFVKMFEEALVLIVTWDVFSKAELTNYNWKEAYKFSIDEEKLAKHILSVSNTLAENYMDVFESIWITKEYVNETIKWFEEFVNNPENFKEKVYYTEIYLTRASDGWANLIFKKIHPLFVENEYITIEILENKMKIWFYEDEKSIFELEFSADKSGKINFDWSARELDYSVESTWTGVSTVLKDMMKFNWFIKNKKSWNSLESEFGFNFNLLENPFYYGDSSEKWLKVKVDYKWKTTKDDSINITKESITENAAQIDSLDKLFDAFELPNHMNIDNYDDVEYTDEFEFSNTWNLQEVNSWKLNL